MSCRRNIATLAKVAPRDDAVFRLAQELSDLRARFAFFESGLAGNTAMVGQALDVAQDALDASQNPRTIVSVEVVDSHLIITFSDGTTQDAGVIGGGVIPATLLNTLDDTTLRGMDIDGFTSAVNALDVLLIAKGR